MLTFDSISEIGSRENNEDSFMIARKNNAIIVAVADGLGGHGRGEVASATVIHKLKEYFNNREISENSGLIEFLQGAITFAQKELMVKQAKLSAKNEMKTTLVLLTVAHDCLCWGHVGDSRLYAFKNGRLAERTLDHSIPQMLVLSKEISERKIRHHPQRNMLLRVLGVEWEKPQYAISEVKNVSDYDALLICSDGFWELISEREMCKYLRKSKTVHEWLQRMTEKVQKNGRVSDMDNYTAIAIWM